MTETTVLDFKLSNTFEEYRAHMNAPEQQAMFAEMGVKTFFIGVCKDDPPKSDSDVSRPRGRPLQHLHEPRDQADC